MLLAGGLATLHLAGLRHGLASLTSAYEEVGLAPSYIDALFNACVGDKERFLSRRPQRELFVPVRKGVSDRSLVWSRRGSKVPPRSLGHRSSRGWRRVGRECRKTGRGWSKTGKGWSKARGWRRTGECGTERTYAWGRRRRIHDQRHTIACAHHDDLRIWNATSLGICD